MGWKVLRKIAKPFENAAHSVGLSGGGVTNRVLGAIGRSGSDVAHFGYRVVKNAGAYEVSMVTLGLVKPKWSGTETASKIGQAVGITAAVVGTGYALGPYLPTFYTPAALGTSEAGLSVLEAASLSAAPAVGEQAGAIAALSAIPGEVAAPAALSGLQLEAAAGSMTVTEGFSLPSALAGSSSLLTGATAGVASATVSKLLTKAVDSVINPLFAPPGGSTGGGGGGGPAGGSPFTDPLGARGGNSSNLYLVAAALGTLLFVAYKKSRG
jgi:hypothetical protein